MTVGFDYWNTITAYPDYFDELAAMLWAAGHELHVVSAIGKGRAGTIENEVKLYLHDYTAVHELIFNHPRESPWLKLELCQKLGITVFYDDRADVCEVLNRNGILAFQVPRKSKLSDVEAERV